MWILWNLPLPLCDCVCWVFFVVFLIMKMEWFCFIDKKAVLILGNYDLSSKCLFQFCFLFFFNPSMCTLKEPMPVSKVVMENMISLNLWKFVNWIQPTDRFPFLFFPTSNKPNPAAIASKMNGMDGQVSGRACESCYCKYFSYFP